ncbi:hypothetical protein D5086_007472 [Populus alba]|uniref:Uncharacterized protein n=1 Tax=Populus alba TaxID=43335 RepID=A0ACC4CNP8_POPAL
MPKSGTTWLKALTFSVVNRNIYSPKQSPLLATPPHELVRFFEIDLYSKNQLPDLKQLPSPRIFSSHSHYGTLPQSIRDSDLKEDIISNLKKIAEFLGIPFTDEEEKEGVIEEISRLCSLDSLRNLEVNKNSVRPSGLPNSSFFRKGEVGDWVNHLSPSMAENYLKIVEEKLSGSGLTFRTSQ